MGKRWHYLEYPPSMYCSKMFSEVFSDVSANDLLNTRSMLNEIRHDLVKLDFIIVFSAQSVSNFDLHIHLMPTPPNMNILCCICSLNLMILLVMEVSMATTTMHLWNHYRYSYKHSLDLYAHVRTCMCLKRCVFVYLAECHGNCSLQCMG